MSDVPAAMELSRAELERMLALVAPDWRLSAARLADDCVTPVYHLEVETPDGSRRSVLKAARPDDHPAVGDVDAEARLLAVVAEYTDAPVPRVVGAVEAAADVRTPFFVMTSLAGETVPAADVAALPDATLRSVARASGEYLAQLHDVPAPHLEGYGKGIHRRAGVEPLRGAAPDGDPAALAFEGAASDGDPERAADDQLHGDARGPSDWHAQLRAWWDEDLEALAGTRFADLAEPLRDALERRLSSVPASPAPRFARVDHGWHNLLVDRDAGELRALLDWGSLYALPDAYDLAAVELQLAGGSWLALDDVPDRRPLVREALLAGYRTERPVPTDYERRRECHQLDLLLAWLTTLEASPGEDLVERGVPEDRVDEAAAGFRDLLAPLLS